MSTSLSQVFSRRLKLPSLAAGLRLFGRLCRGVFKIGLALTALALLPVAYYFFPAVPAAWARVQEDRQLDQLTPARLEKETRWLRAEIARLREENAQLQQTMAERQPKFPYIVVDTNTNTFLMREGESILREGVCSTGSARKLTTPDGRKTWVFNTPKGKHNVKFKQEDPVWKKPDWAYWEEGKKPPSANDPDRFEEGVMGNYALDIGDAYKLHGTLYKRFLGMYVSHGCVRLDDPDIEYLYTMSQKGTEVYIY